MEHYNFWNDQDASMKLDWKIIIPKKIIFFCETVRHAWNDYTIDHFAIDKVEELILKYKINLDVVIEHKDLLSLNRYNATSIY